MDFKRLDKCLCCDGRELRQYIDLGDQPLANSYPISKQKEERFPLCVNVCLKCWHSQLSGVVDRDKMFKNYLYLSGTSKSHHNYFEHLSQNIYELIGCKSGLKILDVGCNDGAFLEKFSRFNWDLYGIDPAENIDCIPSIHRVKGYFPKDISGKYDVITALNVFAHNANPFEFLCGAKDLLNEDGIICIQTSQKDMLTNFEFDTIYHEHQSYFTINSMKTLCDRAGVYLDKVDFVDMHGTSYLFVIRKQKVEGIASYTDKLMEEQEDGKYEFGYLYSSFQDSLLDLELRLREYIVNTNLPFVAYGASAKGVVLLNAFDLRPEYVIDDSPLKQGKNIPGIGCPILPNSQILEEKRDLCILILAWNMFYEIKSKLSVRKNNDSLIRVFPTLEIMEGAYVG